MSGGPRNRKAFAAGQRHREAIRQILLEHSRAHPLGRALTGKEIAARLRAHGISLAPSTVAWHVNRIRLTADIEALDAELKGCNPSNSSSDSAVAS